MQMLDMILRDKTGSRHSWKFRNQGLLPAIIYGHGEPNQAICLKQRDFELAVRHGDRLLKGTVEGKEQHFLIKSVQYDHMGSNILHVDLTRVNLDERVQVTVRIELRGVPLGATEGGVITQHMAQLLLECVVTEIPEVVRVPVTHLKVGDVIRVSDMPLPPGLTSLANADQMVASCTILAEEVVEVAATEGAEAAAVAGAEPEVIGKKLEEGEAEEAEEAAPKKKEKEKE